MTHTFTVAQRPYTLLPYQLLSLFAIINLPRENDMQTNRRVLAIKTLRDMTGMGLFDAKQIVDYIAERGQITGYGEVLISEPTPPVVTYRKD